LTAVHYPVYLEVAKDGRCLAHILDLPGCVARASTRTAALQGLPEAIREHHAWLRRHGEAAPPADAQIELTVAEENTGFGPFEQGDAAALFTPDREGLTQEDMAYHFRLMAHSRATLLALVRDLPGELLDWQPYARSFTLRDLLRHVGNAEQWYVSRLVPPETLPRGWDDDEHLPILTFLDMERRTVISRLQQLTEEERSATVFPKVWTRHPGEPWTARKALRRALEHEREHTTQARDILAARRRYLLARLATERAGLLEQFVGLDHRALAAFSALGGWAAEDLLAHIAAWDRWEHETMRSMVAGETPDLTALQDVDGRNAAFVAAWRQRTVGLGLSQALSAVMEELEAARAEWVAWLKSLAVEKFFRRRAYAGLDWSFDSVPLPVQWEHDATHARQMAVWRQATGLVSGIGPKAILLAALAAARAELLSAAALVPASQAISRQVCGLWTLKDVLGHIADWEWLGVEGLRHMAMGQPPGVEPITDIDGWNRIRAQARRDQPWERVCADLTAARTALLAEVEGMAEEALARPFAFPWGGRGTPYQWICVYLAHDREHAQGLRDGEGAVVAGES
jgi:predicted RNase H-like HicB family nuclease/uncharacterized damage-inducible protein DinB